MKLALLAKVFLLALASSEAVARQVQQKRATNGTGSVVKSASKASVCSKSYHPLTPSPTTQGKLASTSNPIQTRNPTLSGTAESSRAAVCSKSYHALSSSSITRSLLKPTPSGAAKSSRAAACSKSPSRTRSPLKLTPSSTPKSSRAAACSKSPSRTRSPLKSTLSSTPKSSRPAACSKSYHPPSSSSKARTTSKSTTTKTSSTSTTTTSATSSPSSNVTLIHGANGVPYWINVWSNSTWWDVPCEEQAGNQKYAELSAAVHLKDAWNAVLAGWKRSIGNDSRPQKLDEWLWQTWNEGNFPDCFDTSSSQCDDPPSCDKNKLPSAISVIMTGMSGVHRSAAENKQAYQDGLSNLKMSEYAETFTKLPKKESGFDWTILLEALGFVAPGLMGLGFAGRGISTLVDGSIQSARSVVSQASRMGDETSAALQNAKSVLNAAVDSRKRWKEFTGMSAIMGSESAVNNAKNSVDPMDEVEAKLESYVKVFVAQMIQSLSDYLQEMFDGKNQTTQDIWTSLILGGAGWAFKADRNDSVTTQDEVQATMYAGMLSFAWNVSDVAEYPVLLRLDKKKYKYTCGDSIDNTPADQKAPGGAINFPIGELIESKYAKKAMACDPAGNTYMLVNARYSAYTQCSDSQKERGTCLETTEESMPFENLPGIDTDTLNGEGPWYLNYSEVVRSIWGGFLDNNMRNGWEMKSRSRILSDDWTKVVDADTPFEYGYKAAGFVSGVSVCLDGDEAMSRMEKGIHPPCPEKPDTGSGVYTQPDNDAGYASGWCTIHFTKIQKNEGYINPLKDTYLMAVTILDHNGKMIVHAPLQPISDAYTIRNSSTYLGGDFTVKSGSTDKSSDEFWYKDLHWKTDSDAQQCSYGKWDSGKAEGNCGFTCSPDAATGKPSVDVPSDAVKAWLGNSDASATGQSLPSADIVDKSTYKSGTCYVHIYEWQQNEDSNDNWHNPGTYSMSIALYDDDDTLIGFASQTHGEPGIKGPLEWTVFCHHETGGDGAKVYCEYGAQSWTMGGDFEHGYRKLKHDFNC